MGVLEKRSKMNERRKRSGSSSSNQFRGIFLNWQDGGNVVRLVGEQVEVYTHFIAQSKGRSERGLCAEKAFQGADRLPQTINCLDWDVQKEEWSKHKKCPICKLNALAKQALKEEPDKEEREFFYKLSASTYAGFKVKWNVIDRANPYIEHVEGDNVMNVLGLKVATFGSEAYKYVDGIFDQTQMDITDPDNGIDICVVKGKNGMRVVYTANAVLQGTSLKVTPLTDEERALPLHDLKSLCGKMFDASQIIAALHGDLRELLEMNNDANDDDDDKDDDDVIEASEDGEDEDEIIPSPAQKKRGK